MRVVPHWGRGSMPLFRPFKVIILAAAFTGGATPSTYAGVYPGTEWTNGTATSLAGLIVGAGNAINDAGRVVGYAYFGGEFPTAAEWRGGSLVNLVDRT